MSRQALLETTEEVPPLVTPPHRVARIALILALGALILTPAALAGKGGHNGSGSGGTSSGGTISLVLLSSTDGLAHWGQYVTFNVTTSATYPYVTLTCSRNGVPVLTQSAGFFPSYPWGQTFGLSNTSWTSGEADCVADLHYSSSNGKSVSLAKTSFHVYA